MDKTTSDAINRYIRRLIENQYKISEVYLFGSFAKGNNQTYSDIDLAIIMTETKEDFDIQVELMSLTWGVDTRIEPHPFSIDDFNSNNPFTDEIKRTGIKIY